MKVNCEKRGIEDKMTPDHCTRMEDDEVRSSRLKDSVTSIRIHILWMRSYVRPERNLSILRKMNHLYKKFLDTSNSFHMDLFPFD